MKYGSKLITLLFELAFIDVKVYKPVCAPTSMKTPLFLKVYTKGPNSQCHGYPFQKYFTAEESSFKIFKIKNEVLDNLNSNKPLC